MFVDLRSFRHSTVPWCLSIFYEHWVETPVPNWMLVYKIYSVSIPANHFGWGFTNSVNIKKKYKNHTTNQFYKKKKNTPKKTSLLCRSSKCHAVFLQKKENHQIQIKWFIGSLLFNEFFHKRCFGFQDFFLNKYKTFEILEKYKAEWAQLITWVHNKYNFNYEILFYFMWDWCDFSM